MLTPSFDDMVRDLQVLRYRGLAKGQWWKGLPTLLWFEQELRHKTAADGPSSLVIERGLQQAAQEIDGGGSHSTAVVFLFGLSKMHRSSSRAERRRLAARVFYIEPESFRRRREQDIIETLADHIFRLVADR